jgi:hypothetical protein
MNRYEASYILMNAHISRRNVDVRNFLITWGMLPNVHITDRLNE